jgi:hypothetical protein
MNRKVVLVLIPVALALLVAGGSLRRPTLVSATRKTPQPEAAAPASPVVPFVLPKSAGPDADEALKILQLLSSPRQPVEIHQSRQREARERAGRLADRLRANPTAWGDVLDLLCCVEPAESSVALAGLLRGAVDSDAEPLLLRTLRSGSAQGRRTALALLYDRKTSDTLAALQAAAEDADPRLRLDAVLALALRRPESGEVVDACLARRARLEQDPLIRDTARRVLGEHVASTQPAPLARRNAFSGGLKPSPSKN